MHTYACTWYLSICRSICPPTQRPTYLSTIYLPINQALSLSDLPIHVVSLHLAYLYYLFLSISLSLSRSLSVSLSHSMACGPKPYIHDSLESLGVGCTRQNFSFFGVSVFGHFGLYQTDSAFAWLLQKRQLPYFPPMLGNPVHILLAEISALSKLRAWGMCARLACFLVAG